MIGFTRTTVSGAESARGVKRRHEMDWWQQKIEKFPMVRKAAEEALEAFEESGIDDIYTPGSLRVADVAWCFHEDGCREWLITIEEAASEAYKLQGFISQKLAERQIVARVVTEW
jgi:hypothetical protein